VARPDAPRIAVLLPCFNEEKAIAQTIAGFREVLPQAEIYVYDNNSSDRTSEVAAAAGAIVRFEPLRGKGSVVRRMFADIDADFYVMADGDATYDAAAAPRMVERALTESLDMVVGCRQTQETAAYRSGHRFGNRLLTNILSYFFGRSFTDILSGYRVFSRRFVKSFPAFASGFEIETEISVHALRMRMPVGEENTAYFARPEGSTSKPVDDPQSRPARTADVVLRPDRRAAGIARLRAVDPDLHHLSADGSGAALSDRDPDRVDHAAGFPRGLHRADPGYGGARPPRSVANAVPVASRIFRQWTRRRAWPEMALGG
jgi:hypothetical protein